jgi:assimilatory nitrate reductase catalytic subunit
VSPAEIFAEHAALSAYENHGERDFNIGAFATVDDEQFEEMRPFQWPWPQLTAAPPPRFFMDGHFFTPDHRARFVPVNPAVETRTSADYPLILNTGRVRDHWHTMTRTAKSPRLSQHLAEPFVEIHPADAARLNIADADIVRVSAPGGAVLVRVLLSSRQARGSVFVPMHWNDQYASKARVDMLVPGLTDPHSGQPASKHAAVQIERFPAALYGFAVLRERPAHLDAEYWALAPCRAGWRVELAFASADRDWREFAGGLFGGRTGTVTYEDSRAGRQRFARFHGNRLVGALFLAPEPVAVARDWAIDQLGSELADPAARTATIAGRPGRGLADRGATVCSCFGVGANQIAAAVASGCATVAAVGQRLHAGTNCGSCRAEIREIINAHYRDATE